MDRKTYTRVAVAGKPRIPKIGDDAPPALEKMVKRMKAPRVRVDVAPRLFATALADILSDRGYEVDCTSDDCDLAIVEATSSASLTRLEIQLPSMTPGERRAYVTRGGSTREVSIGSLEELLTVLAAELPLEDAAQPGVA